MKVKNLKNNFISLIFYYEGYIFLLGKIYIVMYNVKYLGQVGQMRQDFSCQMCLNKYLQNFERS